MRKKQKNFAALQAEADAAEPEKTAAATAEIADVEAEFVDITNYRRKQKNNLLGVFDGEKYIISDEMISRLIDLPKRFDRFEGNSMYVSMNLHDFVFNFRVDMELEPDFCRGQLYFIEVETGVADDSKHVTLLDDVLDVYTPEFRAKLDEKWNIFYGVETPAADDFLLRYMKMQLEEVYFCRELVDVLSQLYVTRMIVYVAKMGEKGEKIEREFKEEIEKIAEKDPDIVNKHEQQKEVLDKILRKHEAFVEIVKTEEGRKIMKSFSEPLKKVRDKTYPSIMTEVMTPSKGEKTGKAEKADGSGKAGGKSSAGKSAKSAPKSGGGGKKSSPKKSKPYVFKPPKLNPTISSSSTAIEFPNLFSPVPNAQHVEGDAAAHDASDNIKLVAPPIQSPQNIQNPAEKAKDDAANGARTSAGETSRKSVPVDKTPQDDSHSDGKSFGKIVFMVTGEVDKQEENENKNYRNDATSDSGMGVTEQNKAFDQPDTNSTGHENQENMVRRLPKTLENT